MKVYELSRTDARRLAVQAQMLASPRPTALVEVVEQLTLLQIDPTAAVAPSADLVSWSRLGSGYSPDSLRRALEVDRTLFELNAIVRPMSDLALYRPEMRAWKGEGTGREWFEANDSFRRDILTQLRDSGPLQSRQIPDTSVVPWASTGWTNNRNVTQMLEALARRGLVAVAGRQGKQRLWDLAERVYPSVVPTLSRRQAAAQRGSRRLRALGIARASGTAAPIEPHVVGDAGEPAVIEGVEGEWRVDPAALDAPFEGRTALLSPFDRLVHDRRRAQELFDFEYTLEMYKPEASRRWGYFALPILHHDRLVGKLDARADRKSEVFRVNAIHEDVPFDRAMRDSVRLEVEDLANWLGLQLAG